MVSSVSRGVSSWFAVDFHDGSHKGAQAVPHWLGKILRWLSIPLLMVGLIVIAAFAGAQIIGALDTRCAPANMTGGACVESWHSGAIEWVIYVAVFIAAFLLVFLPAWIAPAGKRIVAVLAAVLVTAAPTSVWLGLGWTDFMLPSLIALVSSGLGGWWVWRREAVYAAR